MGAEWLIVQFYSWHEVLTYIDGVINKGEVKLYHTRANYDE